MSKFNISDKTKVLLKNNKVKLCVLTTAVIMVSSISVYKINEKNKASKSDNTNTNSNSIYLLQSDEYYTKLKLNVQKNIQHMEVIRNDENNAYHIIENLYDDGLQRPAFIEYDILYEDAVKVGIDELLNSKVVGTFKVK